MGLDRWHRTRVYGVAFATLFIGNSLQCKNEASVIPPVNQPVSRAAKAEIKAITNQKKVFRILIIGHKLIFSKAWTVNRFSKL